MKTMIRLGPSLGFALTAPLFFALVGCGGGGGDDGSGGNTGGGSTGGGGTVELSTLSGNVRVAGGGPLQDVTVRVASVEGRTDAFGAFVLSSIGSLPVGSVLVELDGSTATPTGPLDFPTLEVMVPLPAGTTALTLPQVITLPDLNNPESANQSLPLGADGSSAVPIEVVQAGGMDEISLTGPMGTIVTVGGAVGVSGVDLNVTPVVREEVPMPLPEGLLGNGFVTIQPSNAAFDPPDPAPPADPVQGLDIVLPDELGLPVGTEVDIWSFDHDVNDWVNRSAETGQRGVVRLRGSGPETEVAASGVITEGGWHAAVVDVDPDCATRISGSVVDQAGQGIAGASIAFSTGQFAVTASDGSFLSDQVPAYDVGALASGEGCFPQDICYEVVLPPCAGGLSSDKLVIASADIVTGGTTPLAPVVFELGTTGTVAGVVIGPATSGQMVTFTSSVAPSISVTPGANGGFFQTGLEAGDWLASFLFDGETVPTEVPFSVAANEITTIVVQLGKGGGGGGADSVSVLVLESSLLTIEPLVPAVGATVRLQGTDSVSAGGLIMLTDANGMATFDQVTGPYTVTAQLDVFEQGVTTRFASSLVGVEAPTGSLGLFLTTTAPPAPIVADATLAGVVSNLPALSPSESLFLTATVNGSGGAGFGGFGIVNPVDGSFSLDIPSDAALDIFLVHRNELAESRIVASLFRTDVGQASSGGVLTRNFDYAATALWDRPVPFTFSNTSMAEDVFVAIEFENDLEGTQFITDVHSSFGGAQNVTLNLPDANDPGLGGFELGVSASVISLSSFQEPRACQMPLVGNPSSVDIVFMEASTLQNPMDGDVFTVADLESLQASYLTGNTGAFGDNGPDTLDLSYPEGGSGTPPAGIDAADWSILVAPGTENFSLPLTGLPMFGPGQDEIFVDLGILRFSGATFDFQSFFNENVAMNLMTLLDNAGQCETFSSATIATE